MPQTNRKVLDYFTASVARGVDDVRLVLKGELDLAAVEVMQVAVVDACADSPALIVVDVSALTYCDSSGVHALLRTATQCELDGTKFRVEGASGIVRRVLEITGTIDALHIGDGA